MGDSFLRAFYTIYDGENRRIGLVGDTVIGVNPKAKTEGAEPNFWSNPLVYALPAALCALCLVAVILSIVFSYRLRKRNQELQRGLSKQGELGDSTHQGLAPPILVEVAGVSNP